MVCYGSQHHASIVRLRVALGFGAALGFDKEES